MPSGSRTLLGKATASTSQASIISVMQSSHYTCVISGSKQICCLCDHVCSSCMKASPTRADVSLVGGIPVSPEHACAGSPRSPCEANPSSQYCANLDLLKKGKHSERPGEEALWRLCLCRHASGVVKFQVCVCFFFRDARQIENQLDAQFFTAKWRP